MKNQDPSKKKRSWHRYAKLGQKSCIKQKLSVSRRILIVANFRSKLLELLLCTSSWELLEETEPRPLDPEHSLLLEHLPELEWKLDVLRTALPFHLIAQGRREVAVVEDFKHSFSDLCFNLCPCCWNDFWIKFSFYFISLVKCWSF